MAWFWRLGMGVAALAAASPAAAQRNDNEFAVEMRRANAATRAYCEQRTWIKKEDLDKAGDALSASLDFVTRLDEGSADQLATEEASLDRRIMMAEMRGDDRGDMRPNALGDMLRRREVVREARENRASGGPSANRADYESRKLLYDEHDRTKARYQTAMLRCLEARDRYPGRAWRDPDPHENSAAYLDPEPADDWEELPDAQPATADLGDEKPEQPGVDYRVWMTGTFDTGGGVMTLNPAGGRYAYQNGRMSTHRIEGTVMEGRWEQDMSAGKCEDGRYWGRYRLNFTSGGFTGVFGYCDEEPHRTGGFQGTRRP